MNFYFPIVLYMIVYFTTGMLLYKEEFEDTTGVIRIPTSMDNSIATFIPA
jgi:hypothetical protein